MGYWTNPSVLTLAGGGDPIEVIQNKARGLVLDAIEEGWEGPPFDPFELAKYLGISAMSRDSALDARIVSAGGRCLRIEFNPNKPRARLRFSIAHEIGHSLFPDCAEKARARGDINRNDEWQTELLCNLAAAEILMPIGGAPALEHESVKIDNILRLQREYDVSVEAISLRMVKLTSEPINVFSAARTSPVLSPEPTYRIDYSVPSRTARLNVPRGLVIDGDAVLSQCTAVGFTAKGPGRWGQDIPEVDIECVGVPPYPGQYFPRIIGLLQNRRPPQVKPERISYLWGDALKPRGGGNQIIAHVVNDKTPNWGGTGFARALRKAMPSAQADFEEWVTSDRRRLSLGNVRPVELGQKVAVVSMIAQHGYGPSTRPRIRYNALRNCLQRLAAIAIDKRASVHMPRIGSGQSRGRWPIVAELIDEILVRRGVPVTVYSVPSSRPPAESQGLLNLGFSAPNL